MEIQQRNEMISHLKDQLQVTNLSIWQLYFLSSTDRHYLGGAVAQSVEGATPGEEVLGSIPAVARSLLVGLVSV